MTQSELRLHEKKILVGLVDFYLDKGHESATLQDKERGGFYENKLAFMLGYPNMPTAEPLPPPEFITAAISLEEKGFVRRIRRVDGQALLGIWPTQAGIARAEFLKANVAVRLWIALRDTKRAFTFSIVTTVVTLVVAGFLGLFGLGD